MDDFQQVRMFLKVAETQSLSAAGRALGVPHSTVSRQLSQLEAQMGALLVQRSTRSFRLTEAGDTVRREFLKIAEAREAIAADLHGDRAVGVLRVSLSHAFALTMVAPTLPVFMRKHPQIRLSLDVSNRRVDPVGEGFDVVIRNGEVKSAALIGRRLGASAFLLCAAPAYLAAAPPLNTPADLAQHQVLAFHPTEDQPQSWTLRRGEERVTTTFAAVLNANDGQVLLAAARGAMGVACLPARLCRDALREGAVVRCLPDWDHGSAETYALYPDRRARNPKVRAFIDHLVAEVDFSTP